jgi:hypothetical protein
MPDMMRHCFKLVIALIIFILQLPAEANDTTARVAAGGITFLKNDQIRLAQEILEISTKMIRVRYRFLNESDRDIRTVVAFPMPLYGWNPGVSAFDSNEKPLSSFVARVDGHSVTTTKTRRAIIGERDVTEHLRKIGLSDTQIFKTFGDCTPDGKCGFTKTQEEKLKQLAGTEHRFPPWKVAETIYWEQVFPAGKEIEVLHEYPPFVGMAYTAPYQKGFGYVSDIPPASGDKDSREACLDVGTNQAIHKRIKSHVENGATMVYVAIEDVEYILGTGRNWKGPITDFRLRIEKDSSDQIISFCFPGIPKRVGSSTLEFSYSNFVPQDKLVVYFYIVDAKNK